MKTLTLSAMAVSLVLTGCASLKYPHWEQVTELKTAYKEHCRETGVDECYKGGCENADPWFMKRATKYDGNHFILEYSEETGSLKAARYYYCGSEVPVNLKKSGIAASVRNRLNPSVTKEDLSQASTECSYEAHKATVDTSRSLPARVYIPTNNFYYNMAALDARATDRFNEEMHDLHLASERSSIYNECMVVKGYIYKRSMDKAALAEVEKYCPDIDTAIETCFIPGTPK